MAKHWLNKSFFVLGLGTVVAIFSPRISIGQSSNLSSNPCYPPQNFSQTSVADVPASAPPVAEPVAAPTPQAEDNFSFDGLMRQIAPNTYGQWVSPQSPSPATRSGQLTPTGLSITFSAAQLKTLTNLKPGGGQGIETMWKLLGAPTRVDLDSRSGVPAIAYWDADGGTVIGVLNDAATRYDAVKLN